MSFTPSLTSFTIGYLTLFIKVPYNPLRVSNFLHHQLPEDQETKEAKSHTRKIKTTKHSPKHTEKSKSPKLPIDMPFNFVTKNVVFSYTPSVNVKKDAGKEVKEKAGEKEKEGQTVEETKEGKLWMSAL